MRVNQEPGHRYYGSSDSRRHRTWTDQRDGKIWLIEAFWSADELMTAQVVFRRKGESYSTWWVTHCTLSRLPDTSLERLLDDARSS